MCTGEFTKHKGADTFRILFLDLGNARLSQMAEAIANAMNLPRFVFSSAGIAPQPLDAHTVEFMTRRGIDLSRQTSKSLEQVPEWDHYQVVIALSAEALQALPAHAKKTICLTWPAPDPAHSGDLSEDRTASFEAAFQYLESHIRELVAAILEQPTNEKTP